MSTEVNLDKLYENSIRILSDLIGFKTISGEDNNDLINYCEKYLNDLGATSFKTYDDEKKRVNLFATIKAKKSNGVKPIILSGHTDTVPVSKSWSTDPFKATIKEDKLLEGAPHSDLFSYSYAKRCLAIQIDMYNKKYI